MRKPKIFLSYSKPNKGFVRELTDRLIADGINVWLDEMEIKVGESIHEKVNDGLKKSDFFAIVLSETSVKSIWVQNELSSASSIEKYKNKGIFILPILIEECDVPTLLLDRRYANFKDDAKTAYQELVDSIFHHFANMHPGVELPAPKAVRLGAILYERIIADPQTLQELPPRLFEELVADLLKKMGYVTTHTTDSKDGGVDIIAEQSNLPGLQPLRIFVECKRTSKAIGINEVQQIIGIMTMSNYDRAMLVTSGQFTRGALETANRARVDLINGPTLSKWIQNISQQNIDSKPIA